MSFTQSIRTCFRKYVTFSGRASRPEYWFFVLFVFLGGMVTTVIDMILFPESVDVTTETTETSAQVSAESGPVSALFSLVTFIPLIAAGWRRMHDSDRSGLHLVYPLIVMIGIGTFAAFGLGLAEGLNQSAGSVIGLITGAVSLVALAVLIISPLLVLWWLTRPSTPVANKYGPHPSEVLS